MKTWITLLLVCLLSGCEAIGAFADGYNQGAAQARAYPLPACQQVMICNPGQACYWRQECR